MIRVAALALLAGLLLGTPTLAGTGLICDNGHDVSVSLPLGGGAGLSLLGVTIKAGDKVWTMDPKVAGATLVSSVQSFAFPNLYAFDFSDPNQERIVAEVRILSTQEDSDPVFAGTLRIVGAGAWTLTCTAG